MKSNRLMKIGLTTLLLLALTCASAMAKVVSAGRDFYYLDSANVLSEALEGEIFFSNQLLDKACGAQVVVVTVDTTGNTAIGEYAYELFNKWGIGDSKRDNGFLLLMAIQDEDYYALCGSGLQSRLTAGTLKQYYDQYLEDDFAAGDYESGARRFFEAIFDRVATTYSANVTVQQGIAAYERYIAGHSGASSGFGGASAGSHNVGGGSGLLRFVLAAVVILLIVRMFRRRRRPYVNTSPFGAAPYGGRPKENGLLKLYLLSRLFRRRRSQNTGSIWQNAHTFRPGGTSHSGSGMFSGLFSGSSSHSGGHRPSGGARRTGGFGGARGGGGRTSGGGAGRGRH